MSFSFENRSDEFFLHQSSDAEMLTYLLVCSAFIALLGTKNNLIIDDFYGGGNLMSLRNLESLEKIPITPTAPIIPKKPMANGKKESREKLSTLHFQLSTPKN